MHGHVGAWPIRNVSAALIQCLKMLIENAVELA